MNYNEKLKTFSIPVGNGYTYAYNCKHFMDYLHKDNGEVVYTNYYGYDLTVSDFIAQINEAKKFVKDASKTLGDIMDNIETIINEFNPLGK